MSEIETTLNRIIGLKDFAHEEIIVNISSMHKLISTFKAVANIYEKQEHDTFDNQVLSKHMTIFYREIEKLSIYDKKHKKNEEELNSKLK